MRILPDVLRRSCRSFLRRRSAKRARPALGNPQSYHDSLFWNRGTDSESSLLERTAKGSFHLSPQQRTVDQKRDQTCPLLVASMLACISPTSSVPSQPTITDQNFLRQNSLAASYRLCACVCKDSIHSQGRTSPVSYTHLTLPTT